MVLLVTLCVASTGLVVAICLPPAAWNVFVSRGTRQSTLSLPDQTAGKANARWYKLPRPELSWFTGPGAEWVKADWCDGRVEPRPEIRRLASGYTIEVTPATRERALAVLEKEPYVRLTREECRDYLPPDRDLPVTSEVYLVRGVRYRGPIPTTLKFTIENGRLEVSIPAPTVEPVPAAELVEQPYLFFCDVTLRGMCFRFVQPA